MGANVAIFFNVYVCILLASFAAKDALEEESLRHQKKRKKKRIRSKAGQVQHPQPIHKRRIQCPECHRFFFKSFNNNNK